MRRNRRSSKVVRCWSSKVLMRHTNPYTYTTALAYINTTKAHIRFLLADFVPQTTQQIVVVPPILEYFYPQLKKDLSPGKLFEISPRFAADLFEHRAALADQDTLLRITLHVDICADISQGRAA